MNLRQTSKLFMCLQMATQYLVATTRHKKLIARTRGPYVGLVQRGNELVVFNYYFFTQTANSS